MGGLPPNVPEFTVTVRLTVVYPTDAGRFFDFDYYLKQHLPMSAELLGPHGFVGYTVQRGSTTVRGDMPPHCCITHLDFESLDGLRAGMEAHGSALREDFARYTDIAPLATVCEVLERQAVGPAGR